MTKLLSVNLQYVATYNCDQSNKGNKYPNDIVRGRHPAASKNKRERGTNF